MACIVQTERASFFESVIDSLDHQVSVIDSAAEIIYVNAAWIAFGVSNAMPSSFDWLGTNYLQVCSLRSNKRDEKIIEIADGIRRVISGGSDEFLAEYPCHSPRIRRWFMMRIATMKCGGGATLPHLAHRHHRPQSRRRSA